MSAARVRSHRGTTLIEGRIGLLASVLDWMLMAGALTPRHGARRLVEPRWRPGLVAAVSRSEVAAPHRRWARCRGPPVQGWRRRSVPQCPIHRASPVSDPKPDGRRPLPSHAFPQARSCADPCRADARAPCAMPFNEDEQERRAVEPTRTTICRRHSCRQGPHPSPDAHVGSPNRILVPTIPGGEPVRRLRIVPPVQLPLGYPDVAPDPAATWWTVPEATRAEVLSLLARLVTKGVVDEEGR